MMDSVKKAFIFFPKALKLFYVVAAVNIIGSIINLLIIPAPVNVEMSAARSFLVIGWVILLTLIGIFVYSGALSYIRDIIKTGTSDIASFLENGKKYFLKILGISILIFLLVFIIWLLLFFILTIAPGALKPLAVILMLLSFIALTIFLIIPPYAAVGGDLGVIDSIKKGILIGKARFWRIFLILLIMLGIALVMLTAASVIIGLFSFIARPIARFVTAIITAIANAVMLLIFNTAFMDFYLKSSSSESKPKSAQQ